MDQDLTNHNGKSLSPSNSPTSNIRRPQQRDPVPVGFISNQKEAQVQVSKKNDPIKTLEDLSQPNSPVSVKTPLPQIKVSRPPQKNAKPLPLKDIMYKPSELNEPDTSRQKKNHRANLNDDDDNTCEDQEFEEHEPIYKQIILARDTQTGTETIIQGSRNSRSAILLIDSERHNSLMIDNLSLREKIDQLKRSKPKPLLRVSSITKSNNNNNTREDPIEYQYQNLKSGSIVSNSLLKFLDSIWGESWKRYKHSRPMDYDIDAASVIIQFRDKLLDKLGTGFLIASNNSCNTLNGHNKENINNNKDTESSIPKTLNKTMLNPDRVSLADSGDYDSYLPKKQTTSISIRNIHRFPPGPRELLQTLASFMIAAVDNRDEILYVAGLMLNAPNLESYKENTNKFYAQLSSNLKERCAQLDLISLNKKSGPSYEDRDQEVRDVINKDLWDKEAEEAPKTNAGQKLMIDLTDNDEARQEP